MIASKGVAGLVGLSLVALVSAGCGGSSQEEQTPAAASTSASASMSESATPPSASASASMVPSAPAEPDYAGFVLAIRESVPQLEEPDDRLIEFGMQLCENTDPQELRNEIVVLATIGGLGDAVASTFAGASFQYLCPDNKGTYNDSLTLDAG